MPNQQGEDRIPGGCRIGVLVNDLGNGAHGKGRLRQRCHDWREVGDWAPLAALVS